MRRLTVTIAALSLMASGGAAAAVHGGPPPFPKLPGVWSHAEINVTIKGVQHTEILDRGRIMQSTPAQLTLRRFDGTTAQIPIGPNTRITLGESPISAFSLRRGMFAETMEIDDGPAVRVKASFRP